nr:isoprenylcysteine carboxylmethyltransferase family protein [Candidatus Freyarchaeota archaeon]
MCILTDDEPLFRISLAVLLILFGSIRGYYTHKMKKVDPELMKKRRMKETRVYERKRDVVIQDLSAIAWAIPMFLYLLVPPWHTWATFSSLPIPSSFALFPSFNWMSWIGVGLGAFSLLLLVWVHRTLGTFWTATLELKPGHQLVTHGPYSRVRHPMYTASLLFMFATGFIATDWVILVVSALTIIIINKRIDKEEEMMLAHFGQEYRNYMQHTRRLLPRLRKSNSTRTRSKQSNSI